ncbi:MAG: formylglycine-generating enzyme family protein [Proteobacteria bacterium]|nr:formylglycine-generating enzyme family protein [Pseudomonadota bacterium]
MAARAPRWTQRLRCLLRRLTLGAALLIGSAAWGQQSTGYVLLPAGRIDSVLGGAAAAANGGPQPVASFWMRVVPVSRAEFQRFIAAHPEWRRDRVPRTFADAGYLADLPDAVPEEQARQPVTRVSWFAAQAYCESEGARLPTWTEWEYAAAADATRTDARADPVWRARILGGYARPATAPLPDVGGPANVYGVRDLHGLVWEWVDDFNALLVSGDSRDQDDPDKLQFCGAGAIELKDRDNYAVLMRIALLSSLQASGSTGNLGFRCVRPQP